jgi:hypothetical protein
LNFRTYVIVASGFACFALSAVINASSASWREPILFVLHLGYAFVPLGALIVVVDTLALSRVGKWRTARLDHRRDGDHDTCGDDTGDPWARWSRCDFHADNNANL